MAKTRDDAVNNQLMFANMSLGVGLVLAFLSLQELSTERVVLTAAFLITGFYFWWGYVFLTTHVRANERILESLYDFILVLILYSLLWIGVSDLSWKLMLWLIVYLALFLLTTLRYVFASHHATSSRQQTFFKRKILVDLGAAGFTVVFIAIAILFHRELLAIFLIFLMELLHIIYVDLTKFYEKY